MVGIKVKVALGDYEIGLGIVAKEIIIIEQIGKRIKSIRRITNGQDDEGDEK